MNLTNIEDMILKSDMGELYKNALNYSAEVLDELNVSEKQKIKVLFAFLFLQEMQLDFISNHKTLFDWKR